MEHFQTVKVAVDAAGAVVEIYYLQPNSLCMGAHIANTGYVEAEHRLRLGIGSRLFQLSLQQARRLDFPAMKASLVVRTITAELPKHLTASKWARCAAIKGESQVPVPTAAWSWNPSEQFATPNGAACFNTGGSYAYAHGGISLQECLTPVLGRTPEGRAERKLQPSPRDQLERPALQPGGQRSHRRPEGRSPPREHQRPLGRHHAQAHRRWWRPALGRR